MKNLLLVIALFSVTHAQTSDILKCYSQYEELKEVVNKNEDNGIISVYAREAIRFCNNIAPETILEELKVIEFKASSEVFTRSLRKKQKKGK